MIEVIRGTIDKPVSANRLADFFVTNSGMEGTLYFGFPIFNTSDGAQSFDALLVSPQKGLIIFHLVEGTNWDDSLEMQDYYFNVMESKLRTHKRLMDRRTLKVQIVPLTFAPRNDHIDPLQDGEYAICNDSNLKSYFDEIPDWKYPECFEFLTSVIQSVRTIRKNPINRGNLRPESRGDKLKRLEESIAHLDKFQNKAVIETVDGVQRIRGLAGTGKTIVLALKAAYLHAKHPNWKIAVTFHTRSLKEQFRKLITTFAIEYSHTEPDWDNLQIIHAWGASGSSEKRGIYYEYCMLNDVEYLDYQTAKRFFGAGREFSSACRKALKECPKSESIYDVILIDEAQDLPIWFLRICFEMLKDNKRLVYAYDELQNLGSKSLPSPEEIFNYSQSEPIIFSSSSLGSREPQQDVTLKVCYRNSRPVLVTAHALGFGIYREKDPESNTGLIQIFDHPQLWRDVGYEVSDGELNDGHRVTLSRSSNESPEILESHSPTDDLIEFRKFDTKKEQDLWVSHAIIENLRNEDLRNDDILVINPDPLSTIEAVGPIRALLFKNRIYTHLVGIDTSPDEFFYRNSVAFTGIYRAKGNEAGMVYVVNAGDYSQKHLNPAIVRNRLFSAITRSKAWVRVLGVGESMDELINEFKQVKKNQFQLRFRYPTEDERKHLNLVNRDMSDSERKKLSQSKRSFDQLLDDLSAGRVFVDDIGRKKVERMKELLDKRIL